MPDEPKQVQPSRDTDLKSKNEPTWPPLGDAASTGPRDGVTARHEWVVHAGKFE